MKRKDTYPGVIENKAVHEVATIMPELVLLDVRTPAEFEARHIPGSHNIPLDQVPFYKDEIAQAAGNACLLLICQSGARARKAAEILQAASLTSMTILEGGIAAWEKAGKPLRQGRQKWSLERQVRGVAGMLVLLGALGGLFAWKPLTWISVLVGGGLASSAVSNTCGMAVVLSKLPYNRGATCNVRDTLKSIARVTG
jgi:rhodanese-related sulfurtransferase